MKAKYSKMGSVNIKKSKQVQKKNKKYGPSDAIARINAMSRMRRRGASNARLLTLARRGRI